jgi:hypothetical protein
VERIGNHQTLKFIILTSREDCFYEAGGYYTCTVQKGDQWCDPYIYPIIDWQNNALMAIGVILGGCFVVPVIHFIWMGLAELRNYIYKKNVSATKSDLPTSIETSRSTSNTSVETNGSRNQLTRKTQH